MIRSTASSRMPSTSPAPDGAVERPGDHWRTAGLALLGVWSALLATAVALWVRVAFFPDARADVPGFVRWVGAPFVLVALGMLWWAWWSVRALRQGRRDGWTLLLVLGGVCVAQSVMTAPGVVAATSGPTTAGGAAASGPPSGLVTGMLVAIALGLVSLVVALLGRRSWAPADVDDPAERADTPAGGLSDPS